jgi:hypothetical protein
MAPTTFGMHCSQLNNTLLVWSIPPIGSWWSSTSNSITPLQNKQTAAKIKNNNWKQEAWN